MLGMKDPFHIAVAVRLRASMRESEIKDAAALAKLMQETPSRVRNWCNGTSSPPVRDGVRLRSVFGVTLDWLYLGETSGLLDAKRIRLAAEMESPDVISDEDEVAEPDMAPVRQPQAAVSASHRDAKGRAKEKV